MLKRIKTSALALLAVTSAAGTAQATTSYSITNSGSKTISDSAGQSWTENTEWGAFGAGYSAGYTIYSNYNGSSKYEEVEGDVTGELFGASFNFVDVSLKAHAGQSSTLYGDYYMSSFGATIFNFSNWSLSSPSGNNKSSVEIGSASWGSDGVSIEECVEADADADMSFVGVPIVATAGASGCLGVTVSASATYTSSTGVSTINFTGTPYGNLGLSVSAGVGTSVASAGAYGEVTLLDVSVPITNTLTLTPTSSTAATMGYSTSGYLNVTSLSGDIGLYVQLALIKYKYSLFSWNGVTWANSLLFTDSVPVAAAPTIYLHNQTATAYYTYSDPNPESGSIIKWHRANDSSGSGSTLVQSGTNSQWVLSENDDGKYLKMCVTPSNGINTGTHVCTGWTAVGDILTYYWDEGTPTNGTSLSLAYEHVASGTCQNIEDISGYWNDDASSYKFHAPSGCSATLYMYRDANCSGTTASRTVAAGGSDIVTSMTSSLGSGWNDSMTSFRVVYCDSVSAEDVSIGMDGKYASGNYTLNSASLYVNDSSSYVWYRNSVGQNAGGVYVGNTQEYTLSPADNGQYLMFCVTPSDGTVSGNIVCSAWTYIPAITFYWNRLDDSDTTLTVPYGLGSSGTCYDLEGLSQYWNDDASAMRFYAPLDRSVSITFYVDGGCSGTNFTSTASAGSHTDIATLSSTFNDKISTFKVNF